MDIYDYVDKYGKYTFEINEFNEIDNLIFSTLSYLDFSLLFNEIDNSLGRIGNDFLNKYTLKETSKYGIAQRDAYKLLRVIVNTKRYKSIEMFNYIYIGTNIEQFCALMFKINKDLIYVSFEGTDNLISGWKEDFQLAYMFPVPAQMHAIKYLKHNVHLFGPKYIIGGHSKGGNLALVAAMKLSFIKKLKIVNVYSNDAPGLRRKEFNSLKYKMIKKKLIKIVPYSSIVGVMLRNDNYKVIKSTKRSPMSHAITSWVIEDNKLVETEFNPRIVELEKSVIRWLDNHDDSKRKLIIDNLFKAFENSNITDLRDLKDFNSLIKLVKEIRNIDGETKKLLISFLNCIIFKK